LAYKNKSSEEENASVGSFCKIKMTLPLSER